MSNPHDAGMTNNDELEALIHETVMAAYVDHDPAPQACFRPDLLARVVAWARRSDECTLSACAAIQYFVEVSFAERDITAETMEWRALAMRLKEKIISAQGHIYDRGPDGDWRRIDDDAPVQPWPLIMDPREIDLFALRRDVLSEMYQSGEISEREFDRRCRELFAERPRIPV